MAVHAVKSLLSGSLIETRPSFSFSFSDGLPSDKENTVLSAHSSNLMPLWSENELFKWCKCDQFCCVLQLLGAAFLGIGLWAWAEKASWKHKYRVTQRSVTCLKFLILLSMWLPEQHNHRHKQKKTAVTAHFTYKYPVVSFGLPVKASELMFNIFSSWTYFTKGSLCQM